MIPSSWIMWEYDRLSFNTGLEGRLSFNMGLEGEHNQKKKEDFNLFKTKSLTNSHRHFFISFVLDTRKLHPLKNMLCESS